MGRSSTRSTFTAASTAWLGWARRGRITQTSSSLIAAIRSSVRSALARSSSTSAMVVAGPGPRSNACRRSTRRSSRISTASRPLVARAIAVSRSRSFSRSSRDGEGAAPDAAAGAGVWEAVTRSREVEVLQVEAVGSRRQAALDVDGLVAARLVVVEQVEHRGVRGSRLVGTGYDEHAGLQPAHLVVRDHDRDLAARQLDQRAHGEDADRGDELLHQGLVEEFSRPSVDAAQRLVGGGGGGVGAVVGERSEGVHDAGHAPVDADLLAHVAVRIAASVHSLVVLLDALDHLGVDVGGLREDVDAVLHVALRLLVFLGGEPALLLEEVARQLDLADVQQQPDLRELLELRLGKAQVAPERGEVHRDLQAVAVGGDVLLAKARDPHRRVGVANDALDHLLHD